MCSLPRRGTLPGVAVPVLPGATIGVLGSGQLGRMLGLACRRMGYRMHVFSPERDSPAGQVADREVAAPYDDLDAVRAFARAVNVVTFEFENVPAATAAAAAEHPPVTRTAAWIQCCALFFSPCSPVGLLGRSSEAAVATQTLVSSGFFTTNHTTATTDNTQAATIAIASQSIRRPPVHLRMLLIAASGDVTIWQGGGPGASPRRRGRSLSRWPSSWD